MMPFSRPKADRSLRRITLGRGRGVDITVPPKGQIVTSVTTLVEGVHFDLAFMTARELGHKALAIALSEAAATAMTPLLAHVTPGTKQETGDSFFLELESGLASLSRKAGIDFVLAPAVDSPQALLLAITLVSHATGKLAGPAGARSGDVLVVTGSLGASAAGLNCLKRFGRHAMSDKEEMLQPHLTPQPRLEEAALLLAAGPPTAMVELGDGIAADLHTIAEASGVGALVDQNAFPVSQMTLRAAELLGTAASSWALYGAEDFELLAAIPARRLPHVQRAFAKAKRPLTVIGVVRPAKEGVRLRDLQGELVSLQPRLWHPFVRRRKVK